LFDRGKRQVGRHQFGQRRRFHARAAVLVQQYLIAGKIVQQVGARFKNRRLGQLDGECMACCGEQQDDQ
jgi:hypothetical protein